MSKPEPTWEFVELPTGPQQLPPWALGLHVEWADGYGNAPSFILKTDHRFYEWPDKRWTRKNGAYTARHPDGRGEVHYHSGRISEVELTRRVRTSRTEWVDEKYTALATTVQEGYGGRAFPVTIGGKDEFRGKTVILRGPWYGGSPPGYVTTSVVEIDSKHALQQRGTRWQRPWFKQTACFGSGIREDVFVRIFAKFQPHLRLARVTEHFSERPTVSLQPLKPEWDVPKRWIQQGERDAWQARQDAIWAGRDAALQPVRDLGFDPVESAYGGKEHFIATPDGGRITFSLLSGSWYEYGAKPFGGRRAEGKGLETLLQRLAGLREAVPA